MAKKTNFTDPFVKATTEPVSVGGQEVGKVGVCVKDDDGQKHCVAVLGKDYNLIQNSVARDVASDVMSRSPWDWKEIKTVWDGHKFLQYHVTNESIHESGNLPLHVGIMVRNAYDGTGCFGFEIFAFNMVCSNQYISRNRFGFFAIRHLVKAAKDTGKFDIDDALGNIQIGSQKILELAPVLQEMRNKPLKLEHVVNARKHTSIPESKWGAVLEQLSSEESNIFGLFQALTFVSTHQVQGFRAVSIGDSVTNYMLKGN